VPTADEGTRLSASSSPAGESDSSSSSSSSVNRSGIESESESDTDVASFDGVRDGRSFRYGASRCPAAGPEHGEGGVGGQTCSS